MISPEDIRQRALKFWQGPGFLRAVMEGHDPFPWEVPFAKPRGRALNENFGEIKEWLRLLRSQSKQAIGYGYRVDDRSINHRRLGVQALPRRIFVESRGDFLRLINKQKEFGRFERLVSGILADWPQLKGLIMKQPHIVLEHAGHWDCLLAVCRYFVLHPRPSIYLRQLDIAGVDTKFIETNKKILSGLLDVLLPASDKDANVKGLGDDGFERRFGLCWETPSVRFRLLDRALYIHGLSDLAIPLSDFQGLAVPAKRVFIVENKVNGLCFPQCPQSMVVFGLGYGLGVLSGAEWIGKPEVFYWGDIDTHGFAILDRLRAFIPQARSFLMDMTTLHHFKNLWGKEDPKQRFTGTLFHLNQEENTLFEQLRSNELGECVRLEQERISYNYIRQKVAEIAGERRDLV